MKLDIKVEAKPHIKKIYDSIFEETEKQLEVAQKAKEKGLDVSTTIESKPVADLADRTETIIGPVGIAERYRAVFEEKKGDRLEAIFQLFREILEQKWCKIEDEGKRVEQAIKTALVLNTEGVVVAPLDGVPKVEINKNPDGSNYIDIYYAGPIRAAGGTSQVLPLILGDYARIILELDRYKPTDDEVERYVEECQIYDEIVTRQYKPTDDEVRKIVRGCTVCINGEPTEEREVAVNRDLKRIPNNRIRGGMCLVLSEGVALKAAKIMKFSKKLGLDWKWLEDIIKVGKSDTGDTKIKPLEKFLIGAAAGRPILAYPSRLGGFRLRYGRARNMGIMGKGIHPATMHLLEGFIANATQMKVERPGKAAGMAPVDSIEGPIIRLLNGTVVQVNSLEEAIKLKPKLERILFLGDILVAVGDFRYSAHPLVPAGYCSEWWEKESRRQLGEKAREIEKDLKNHAHVTIERALELSEKHAIPLHPNALFYYMALDKKRILELVEYLKTGKKEGEKIVFDKDADKKKLFEKIGLCHEVEGDKISLKEDAYKALEKTLGMDKEKLVKAMDKTGDLISALTLASGIQVRDKAGTWIGARMGRPEASKPRKMAGNPHVLFPIGNYGGNTRSINKAMLSHGEGKEGTVNVEIALYKCPKCDAIRPNAFCRACSVRTEHISICPKCGKIQKEKECGACKAETEFFSKRGIDLQDIVGKASENLGIRVPDIVKGVKGMINTGKIAEPIEKGLLRAKYDLHVFRDATIRYEAINAPLTHFKPSEVGITVEKARELGYEKDCHGNDLVDDEQILEIFPQDVVINEGAGDFFVQVTRFVDEMLQRFYKQEAYFKAEKKEDLVGQLVLGLAPHTSAAVVGRILGYTKARACFAHPYFHQTKRRNIDGDQDSLMLLMDNLLNFSHSYLPGSRGGRMDAALVFTVALRPTEIDNECYDMETCWDYPINLYENAQRVTPPEVEGMQKIENILGKPGQYSGFGYSHETTQFDAGPTTSKYVQLTTMEEKLRMQARLQGRIEAVDSKDALERVMVTHLLPDIIGNTRAFSRQNFRCTNCNAKMRRIPLDGKCPKCKQEKIILTVNEGGVRKYLEIARTLAAEFELSDYLQQRLELINQEIDSVFRNEKPEQRSLAEFV